MVTKLISTSVLAIILLVIIAGTSAQYGQYGYGYGHPSHPYYQQQRPIYGGYPQNAYQQQPQKQLPPGVTVQEAEWVCKNPKTGDMMIISAEDVPSTNTGNSGQPQQPTFTQVNPQPTYPQPTPTESPQPPSTGVPNSNGDGLIDIRAME